MIKITMMTKWFEEEIVCCCPIKGQCLKNHDCEQLKFYYDPYSDIEECMQHDSFKRKNGAIRQIRQVKKE